MARRASAICIALSAVAVATAAATNAGAARSPNGQIAFAATVGSESRIFTVTPGAQPTPRTLHQPASASPAWAPDGRHAVVASPPDRFDNSPITLFVVDLATGAERPLTSPLPETQDRSPAWSPDGRWIAFTRTSPQDEQPVVMLVHPDGSGERVVGPGVAPAWSPDSRQLAFAFRFSVFRIAVTGGGRHLVRTVPVPAQVDALAWSRDGRRIAYVTETYSGHPLRLWWTSIDGRHRHSLGTFAVVSALAWTRDDRRVLAALPRTDGIDGARLVSIGRDHPALRLLARVDSNSAAWSASRKRILLIRDGVLWVAGASGAHGRAVTPGAGSDDRPAYSPDGSLLAYVNAGHLMVMAADGTGARTLAPEIAAFSLPAWSPDGRSIVVWSYVTVPVSPDPPTKLFVIDVASGTARAISPIRYGVASVEAPQWSPDGRRIAYHWHGSTRFGAPASQGAAVVTADGSATYPIDAREVTAVAWAPDGARLQIAYESDAGSMQLATFDPATGALTPVPAQLPAASPGPLAWAPDGKHLAVNLRVGSRAQIAVMDADGSDARVLDADSTVGDTLAGWSPDGTRVLVTRGDPGVHPSSVWSLGIAAPGDARRETPADLDAFDPVWQVLPEV